MCPNSPVAGTSWDVASGVGWAKEARDEAEQMPGSIAKELMLTIIAETWERLVLCEQRQLRKRWRQHVLTTPWLIC